MKTSLKNHAPIVIYMLFVLIKLVNVVLDILVVVFSAKEVCFLKHFGVCVFFNFTLFPFHA